LGGPILARDGLVGQGGCKGAGPAGWGLRAGCGTWAGWLGLLFRAAGVGAHVTDAGRQGWRGQACE